MTINKKTEQVAYVWASLVAFVAKRGFPKDMGKINPCLLRECRRTERAVVAREKKAFVSGWRSCEDATREKTADRDQDAELRERRTEQLLLEFADFVRVIDQQKVFDSVKQCIALERAKHVLAAYPNIADRKVKS